MTGLKQMRLLAHHLPMPIPCRGYSDDQKSKIDRTAAVCKICKIMRLTKTQTRLMTLLRDEKPHQKRELREAIDELCSDSNRALHLWTLRQKLRSEGLGIVFHSRQIGYQICRFAKVADVGNRFSPQSG